MCSCNDYTYESSGNEEIEFAIANRMCKLVPLNFTSYETCGDTKQLKLGVPLFDVDKSNMSVSRCEINPHNFDVFYDGKTFRLFLKAFDGKIKRSRCFCREKHVKIKDICLNRMLWEVFWNIKKSENLSKKKSFLGFPNGIGFG